jgi:putative flavoprotein involved in K+ transport
METKKANEHYKVIVIGAGQAGLAIGYFLKQSGVSFIIVDANKRIGDSWRNRWDTLKLFTPSKIDGLPGLPFPGRLKTFPTKDEMGDYLEMYAKKFQLPVQCGTKVSSLSREGKMYLVATSDKTYEADHVVVAMSDFQFPKIPTCSKDLNKDIIQIHSHNYKNLSQLQDGSVLVVGAGNSGAELALEASKKHEVWLAGRDTGHVPFNIESNFAHSFMIPLVIRFFFHRILNTNTFIGRKLRPKILSKGGPLIRHKPEDLKAKGIHRIGRVTGVKNGLPIIENNDVLSVKNIIWCTGYIPGFSWIDIPVFNNHNTPVHHRGVVNNEPGLYFLGLHFLFAMSSAMIHGVSRDAEYISKTILNRIK